MIHTWKLADRKVVVTENGKTHVVTAPCGVNYSETQQRWSAGILDDQGEWISVSFGVATHGFMSAFKAAVEIRRLSLKFLLNRRMLPRLRKAYNINVRNGLYVVRDPLAKNYRYFDSKKAAEAFNVKITQDWVKEYTFNEKTMIVKRSATDEELSSIPEPKIPAVLANSWQATTARISATYPMGTVH